MIKNILIIVLVLLSFNTSGSQTNVTYVCPPCYSQCDTLEFKQKGECKHCGMKLIPKKDVKKLESDSNKKRIAFYLQDGVEVLDFAGPLEVFSYAGHDISIISKTTKPIVSQGVLSIVPDYDIKNAPQVDVLVFFGGNTDKSKTDSDIINWINSFDDIDNYFSVCTGAFFLAEAGILKNKTATTFHYSIDNLEKSYKDTKVLRDARYVDNGKVITTAGISAGIDGALHLVAKWQGFNVARKVAYIMEYDKWVPGEGVILSKDDPYKDLISLEKLEDYSGIYKNEKGIQVKIIVDNREKGLYAQLGKRKTPLFHEKDDLFSKMNQATVTFIRNESNQVVSMKSNEHKGSFVKQ